MKKYKHWVVLFSALFLLGVSYYFTFFNHTLDAFLLYFILPIGIIIFVLGEKTQHYGLRVGKVKTGLILTVIGSVVAVIVTFLSVKYIGAIQSYYTGRIITLPFIMKTVTYMFAWEFIFRGYMLFGLKERFGNFYANKIQTALFFFAHIGKPQIEMISTLFTGVLFGHICLKSKSFLPMVVIHSVIMISVVFFVSLL